MKTGEPRSAGTAGIEVASGLDRKGIRIRFRICKYGDPPLRKVSVMRHDKK